jgi:hypothetical protein
MTRSHSIRWIPALVVALGCFCLSPAVTAQVNRQAFEDEAEAERVLQDFLARTARLVDSASRVSLTQAGDNAAIIVQNGNGNIAEIVQQSGTGNRAYIEHDGHDNQTYLLQSGNDNAFSVTMIGDRNYFDFAQVGDGNQYERVWVGSDTDLGTLPPVVQTGNGNQIIEIGQGGIPLMIEQRGDGMRMVVEHHRGF